MPAAQSNPLNEWRHDQPGVLLHKWTEYIRDKPEQAFHFINDPTVEFPTVFILKDALDFRNAELDSRVKISLAHTRNILRGADIGFDADTSFLDQHDQVVDSLSWVLKSGWNSILSTDYTQVIDQTAIQLLLIYHHDVIKEMADLIMYRYKNKSQRHYLISALLESAEPRLLVYLANYLLSDQTIESDYARKMLGFIPEVRHAADSRAAFLAFESWYETNEHYLVYTGETNDAVPGGRPFRIHYSAKYLGKSVNGKTGQPIQDMLPIEKDNYHQFIQLPDRVQVSLSAYSAQLRQLQPKTWRQWTNQPLAEQMAAFKLTSGGMGT
ncbi:hypothetical protein [Sporolactobacillus spathodeae]|uniref:DUF4132 domain-containing protein n=1 Tax=Sporolactobacillus spathodeae TaxID=1465502 RepID=A0ABS2QAT5_9BACL|nr:hypothetical protein [Sporolactobacillus spathodeae]MBM7658843.1 hypothetical protein [Sporolactobacillus spathodeae]